MADKLRVLYVDNEPGLLEIGKLFLEREGSFAVDTFLSAKQAFEQLKTEKYDAIISDYQMPEMDGISFLKRLKASDDTTPFIIFTARGREDVVIEALNNGADFYVQIGGESNSQFAELSNKIRYAVSRKRAEESLRKREEQLSLAIEASGAGLWDWKVQTGEVIFNERWAEILGYTLSELSPVSIKTWETLIHKEDLVKSNDKLKKYLSGETPVYECEARMLHKDGHLVWVLDRGKVVEWDEEWRPVRMTGTHLDITGQKKQEEEIAASLREKETLLTEIHHRVKNNMQVISSLLHLQRKQISDLKTREMFQDSENRIFSIALVHETLYHSKNLSLVDVNDYLHMMGDYLFSSLGIKPGRLELDIKAEGIFISIDKAIPISLITNELLTNSLKHAFPDERKGRIQICITQENGKYRYIFHDDGIGFPAHVDFSNTEYLGMQLVDGLVSQILGSLTRTRENGTKYEIVFTIENNTAEKS